MAVSRVLLGRHHILDVVAGVVIGVLEAVLLSMLWRSEEEVAFETSNFENAQELINFTGKRFGQLSAWIGGPLVKWLKDSLVKKITLTLFCGSFFRFIL